MDAGVEAAEVAKYREMMRNGRTLPSIVAPQTVPTTAKPRKKNPQAAGRFQVMNDFADTSAKSVSTTAQAAWWILFRETKSSGLASVSFNQVADAIGLQRRAAIRAIQELETAGLLTVVKRGSLNVGPSTYQIHATPKGDRS